MMSTAYNLHMTSTEYHLYMKYKENNLMFDPEDTLKDENASEYLRKGKGIWGPRLLSNFSKTSRKCMEVNCAFGDITSGMLRPLFNRDAVIIGTDVSEKMIDFAKRNYGNNEQIDFEVLDIQTRNLPEKYISEFHHIFSFPTIFSRNDIRQEFENIYRMLRPNGFLHMSLVTSHNIFGLFHQLSEIKHYAGYLHKHIEPFRTFDFLEIETALTELLTSIGFRVHICQRAINRYYLDYLLHYTLYDLPFFNDMPTQIVKNFKDDFRILFNKMSCRIVSEAGEMVAFDRYHTHEVLASKPSAEL